MSGSHTFSLTATAEIGSDTNSFTFVLDTARFWPKRWLAVRTMPQDLIGCGKRRKLKALIHCVVVFVRRREGSILLSFLLFYGRIVGKYALICAVEIQKIQMVVHIF